LIDCLRHVPLTVRKTILANALARAAPGLRRRSHIAGLSIQVARGPKIMPAIEAIAD
jgi:hypothetical protein